MNITQSRKSAKLRLVQKTIPTNLLNSEELAKALSVSIHSVRKWRFEGKVPCYKLGKSVRYDIQAVITALQGVK